MSSQVTAAAMSGDGRRALSGSFDKMLKVCDLTTSHLLRALDGHAAVACMVIGKVIKGHALQS